MNHSVHPLLELKPNAGSDRSWTWTTTDYSENPASVQTFAIRFKNSDVAAEFNKQYDAARANNANPQAAAAPAAAAAAPAAAAAAPAEAKEEVAAVGTSVWVDIIGARAFEPLTEADLKKLWATFDQDGSNFIDAAELGKLMDGLLAAICKILDAPLTEEVMAQVTAGLPAAVASTLKTLDKNQDGKLSWEEFIGIKEVQLALGTPSA
mmetsp:Transcript_16181/g.17966  ORF Transcript_16181/g.17966 Transcript_16181/m.17966 type:complete len:208 (-) Transcript_16181:236-859(-)